MTRLLIVITLVTAALIGCGGGGGGGASQVAGSSSVISGVASAGSPITGGTISLLSSNGLYYSTNAVTASDGTFSFDIDTSTYNPPYILKITKDSGQSAGSYYAYATSSNLSGLLVTPISSATLGLAADSNLSQIFESGVIPTGLNSTSLLTALDKIFAATADILSALSISDKSLLLNNTAYVADGTGQDASLDALSFQSANANDGSIMVGSKITGASKKIESSTALGSISAIPFSLNGSNLLVAINNKVNQANACLKTAFNNQAVSPVCVHASFQSSAMGWSDYVMQTHSYIGNINSVGVSSLSWCEFDDSTKSFNSAAIALANQTGTCNASFAIAATNATGVVNEYYKFVLNASGSDVSEVKLYGNQLTDTLTIEPRILKKIRVDGFSTNVGVTSGYMFEIGTALQRSNGNPTPTNTSNLSAKVEILDSTANIIDTFYMECQQGAYCINSHLAVCKNKSATCANGVDTLADNIISVNSTLSTSIVAALQQGFVKARVTTYNKILSDGSKIQQYSKTMPIMGFPVSQDIVNQINFPSLNSASVNALASWAGDANLTLAFDRGDSKVSVKSLTFMAQPSAGIDGQGKSVIGRSTSVAFSNLLGNGQVVVPLTADGCSSAQSNGYANWRSVFIYGVLGNVPVEIKQFGSCNSGDY